MTQITPEDIADFERHLQAQGCYAPSTIRRKTLLAQALQTSLEGGDLPLDEDLAVEKIRGVAGPGRRRRTLNTTARDLIAFYQVRGPQGASA
ncbi:hypothetical protein DSECCO2_213020 [anaerobic digester metagenome]